MNHYRIRFNKTRGQPGRGSEEHVWRVFENNQEYLVKNCRINVTAYSERDGEDWNIACDGYMVIDRETSTITINSTNIDNMVCKKLNF